jgi:hypothetical protein
VTWRTGREEVSCPVQELQRVPLALDFAAGLVDVQSQPLRLRFDAGGKRRAHTPEVALACGWRYAVAGRWREHVVSTLDGLSSRRRHLSDPLGLRHRRLGIDLAEPMADRGRQPRTARDLEQGKRELAELRMAHLLEVATGFRSGDA